MRIMVPLSSFEDPVYRPVEAELVPIGEFGEFYVHRKVIVTGMQDGYVVSDSVTCLALFDDAMKSKKAAVQYALEILTIRGVDALRAARVRGLALLANNGGAA